MWQTPLYIYPQVVLGGEEKQVGRLAFPEVGSAGNGTYALCRSGARTQTTGRFT